MRYVSFFVLIFEKELDKFMNYSLKPNFKVAGPMLGKNIKAFGGALAKADAAAAVAQLESEGKLVLELNGENVDITPDMVDRKGIEDITIEDIKAAGYNAVGQMAGENAWTSMLWYSLLVEAIGGADVYADGLSNPAFVEAAEVLKEMYKYTFDGAISAGAGDVNGHFIARDTALYLNGPWWIANFYKEDNAVDGQLLADVVDVATNPVYEGGKGEAGGLVTTVQSFVLCAKQDDPAKEEAVIKFLQYITDPDRMAEWSLSAGSMFFAKYTPSEDANAVSKKFTQIANDASYTVLHVNGAFPAAFATAFPEAVSALVLDQVDAQGFVDMLQTAIDMA